MSLLSCISYTELAVPLKTENFLGTWGREIPGQGRSDRTEEDLVDTQAYLCYLTQAHLAFSLQVHKSTPSKAWCCTGTAVMSTLQEWEKCSCDYSAKDGKGGGSK